VGLVKVRTTRLFQGVSIVVLGSAILSVGSGSETFAQSAATSAATTLPPVVVQRTERQKRAHRSSSATASRSASRNRQTAASRGASTAAAVAAATSSSAARIGSPVDGYAAPSSSAALKTDTPLIRTPASVSVVTRQQMIDQGAQSVAQALRYTPGVFAEQRGINTDSLEYLYARGFQAETYLDGLRQPAAGQAGFNIMSRDAYLIDRIESIRGPASIVYGQTPPGGIFNIVSKLPQETPFNEVFFQTGSYGRVQGGFDTTGPLNDEKTLLYRVTGVGLNTGTQTDFVDQQRVAIAPSFTWKIDPDTKLTVTASYQNDPKAGIYSFVPAAGTVLPGTVHIPRSMYLGEPTWDQYRKQEANLGYQFEHQVNDIWQVKQSFRYTYNDIYIRQDGPSGVFTNNGTVLGRLPYINSGVLNSVLIDNEAIAKFRTGVLRHEVLLGADYQNTQYDHYLYNGYTGGVTAQSLNLLNPVYGVPVATPNNKLGTSMALNLQQTGVYGQDQIGIGNFTILGGVRQDWATTSISSFVNGSLTQMDASATTGRAAIMYNFENGIAPYFSYATSFQPVLNTPTNGGAPYKPTEGEQYEIGVKYQPPGTNSIFTVAAYDLRQTNVLATVALNVTTQVGEVRSRGIELEARTDVTNNLQAIASYTYDDVENTNAAPTMLGKAPIGIPLNMASLWLGYDMPANVAPGLKLSGGVRYIDDTWGDTVNSFKVPSFTLFDIGVQYDFGRQFPTLRGVSANLNVTNLFDKTYISSCTTAATCTYGAGRMVLAGVKYRW
jgi:iron complex outermembrane recepter protein